MATTFSFKLVTPTGVLYDGQAEQVNAVNPLGEFGVLADHVNYITSLVPGVMTIRNADGRNLQYLVTGGLVEVKDGEMTALAPEADPIEKVLPPEELELKSAEDEFSQMNVTDTRYEEVRHRLMLLRARRDIAEARRLGAAH
jgi:F-type H+-transporting ATPase subunit epsilon